MESNIELIIILSTASSSSRTSKPVIVAAIAYLAAFFALASGVFNAIIEGGGGSQAFILPTRSAQTTFETVVTAFLLFIGTAGTFLLYKAGKAATSRGQGALLGAGFAIIGIALMLGFTLISLKT